MAAMLVGGCYELTAPTPPADDYQETEAAQEERITGFYRAQSMWDATMADTLVRAIDDGGRPVVHVVGQFHSDHDGGLVLAVRAERPGVRIVTVSMSDGDGFTDDDIGLADYVVLVGEAP